METKNKIESMVELRTFAVEMAVKFNYKVESTIKVAKEIENYIKGDAQLPEIKEENDKMLYEHLIKMWEENNKIEKQRLDSIFAELQKNRENNIDPHFLVKDNTNTNSQFAN